MSSAEVVERRTLPFVDDSSSRFSSDFRVESFLLALSGPEEGLLEAEWELDLRGKTIVKQEEEEDSKIIIILPRT